MFRTLNNDAFIQEVPVPESLGNKVRYLNQDQFNRDAEKVTNPNQPLFSPEFP